MLHTVPLPSLIVLHLALAYVLLVAPFTSRRSVAKVQRAIEAGDTEARMRMYRDVIASQGLVLLVLFGLMAWGGIPPTAAGFGPAYSWPWCLTGTGATITLLVWSGLRFRHRADSVRERLRKRPNPVIPTTNRERAWFAVMGFTAGATEEVLCRGFLFYCLQLWFPRIPLWQLVVVASAAFGFAHLYQGVRGILATGIGGAVMGLAYVASGNLFFPVLFHGFINARIVFLPAESPRQALQPATA